MHSGRGKRKGGFVRVGGNPASQFSISPSIIARSSGPGTS